MMCSQGVLHWLISSTWAVAAEPNLLKLHALAASPVRNLA